MRRGVVFGQACRRAWRKRTSRAVTGLLLLLLAGCAGATKDATPLTPEPSQGELIPREESSVPETAAAREPDVGTAVVAAEPNRSEALLQNGAEAAPSPRPDPEAKTRQEGPSSRVTNVPDRAVPTAPVARVRVIQPGGKPAALIGAAPETGASKVKGEDCPPTSSASATDAARAPAHQACRPAALANANEVVRLDLPAQLDLIQLLDLVGEYLQLDYLYDPEKIKGQVVTLKLHGKLQGQVQVRDLYLLLESVLKFKGFAMICHQGNLVTIVPAADALKANPDLLDPERRTIGTGDMVVTDLFDLHHISVSAATTLLQNMQLSLATTPVEGAPTLIVTCYAHQIERIERLLNIVDRAGQPREFRFRPLKYTLADALTRKIQVLIPQLGGVSITTGATPVVWSPRPGGPAASVSKLPPPAGGAASSENSVYLDADERTNRLLMIGVGPQLAVVEKLVDALDVAQQDLRVLKIYEVQHVEAQEVKKKLQELEIIGTGVRGRTVSVGPAGKSPGAESAESTVAEQPVVVVLEATNALVVNASEEQHARVEAMMAYLDAATRTETIPYEIYSLENQDPTNVAQVLEKIVQETVQDREGKLQKIVRNTEEQVVIVPDKNTFSLIVYASRKNQEWIRKLIETLDRRRPQVLIDVTLVEIRKMDEFNYDLNLIASLPDLVETAGQTGQFYAAPGTTVVDKLVQSHRSRFVDVEIDSGTGTGFYADRHINALLKAVQTRNYGRVLAKPKVLVNDNEKGTIKTADTTYVVTKSAIPVTAGTAGPQNTLIETAVKYEPYDAGITLEITPHISEKVLRLEIKLNRSDFTSVTTEKPPDETSSDIATIVTVPDRSTIILGGMLRLNQTKSGSKVPILGDLPIVGGVFRSIANSDIQSKLYIFVRAEVIRPVSGAAEGAEDLQVLSEKNREAFEEHELQFQKDQSWPGIKSKLMEPPKVLEAR